MYHKVNPKSFVLIFVMSFSLVFLAGASEPKENPESLDNQPSYIDEMVESSQLTQSQVDNMKNGGESWGNIRITARMAEQIAAKNSDSEKTAEQKYQEALDYVLQQRAAGKGYGNIANENNINLGSVMRNDNATQNQQKDKTQLENQNKEKKQSGNSEQTQVQQQAQTQTKKKGLLGRFFGIFSKDKTEQKQENVSKTQTKKNVSNKEQTQNTSSSQKLKTQESTETVQKNQQKTRTEEVGNTSGNQGSGNSRGGGRGK